MNVSYWSLFIIGASVFLLTIFSLYFILKELIKKMTYTLEEYFNNSLNFYVNEIEMKSNYVWDGKNKDDVKTLY